MAERIRRILIESSGDIPKAKALIPFAQKKMSILNELWASVHPDGMGRKRITFENGSIIDFKSDGMFDKIFINVPLPAPPMRRITEESRNIYPVPIFEIWDTLSDYNIMGLLSCGTMAFGPSFIYAGYDSPYHVEAEDDEWLWEEAHERQVLNAYQNEPFFYHTTIRNRSYERSEIKDIKIEQLKKVGLRNRYYWDEDSEHVVSSTGWAAEPPQGSYPSYPWWQEIKAQATESDHAWGDLYLNSYFDEYGDQYPTGPIFSSFDYSTSAIHTTTVTRYYPSSDISTHYGHNCSTVIGSLAESTEKIWVFSSSVVVGQDNYSDYSHYCFVLCRAEWEYNQSVYCDSWLGPDSYNLDPGVPGRTIGCFYQPDYVIRYYINVDGTEYLIHTGSSEVSFNSWFCDIYENGQDDLVFVYSWLENSSSSFSPVAYHYGMIWRGNHYQSEAFPGIISISDYRHYFSGAETYPDSVSGYGGLGFLRVGRYTEEVKTEKEEV